MRVGCRNTVAVVKRFFQLHCPSATFTVATGMSCSIRYVNENIELAVLFSTKGIRLLPFSHLLDTFVKNVMHIMSFLVVTRQWAEAVRHFLSS